MKPKIAEKISIRRTKIYKTSSIGETRVRFQRVIGKKLLLGFLSFIPIFLNFDKFWHNSHSIVFQTNPHISSGFFFRAEQIDL